MGFYSESLQWAVEKGHMHLSDRVLVVGGGESDRRAFHDLGFTQVLITNLAPHAGQEEYAPYPWKREDAEDLSFEDDSFDWVVEHAALHHMGSPHKGFLEMLRVARKGVLAFEARDSLLMRLAVRWGLTSKFELEPIFISNGTGHGFRNLPIPNFITRWTENEVRKTVYSMYPAHEHMFQFFYGLRVPVERFRMARSPLFRLVGILLNLMAPLIDLLFKKQGNYFGFLVMKNIRLQPWIRSSTDGSLSPDIEFLGGKYDRSKYRRG